MINLKTEISKSNINDDAKKELLKVIDTGYGIFFIDEDISLDFHPIFKTLKKPNSEAEIIHTLIKGDNLYALTALHNNFNADTINFIYIDPPYNTGNHNFKYKDNRVHSDWLSFMKKRLILSKKILSDDGVIAISIDDNELYSLKLLLDKIYGPENFICNLIWHKKYGGGQDSKFYAVEHEYILIYAKNKNKAYFRKNEIDSPIKEFSKEDKYGKYKIMKLEKWGIGSRMQDAPTLHYPIKDPDNKDYYPIAPDGTKGRWRKKPQNLKPHEILWQISKGKICPYEKIYFNPDKKKKIIPRSILYKFTETGDGSKELKKILKIKQKFDYPKPPKLMKELVKNFTRNNGIVLDFFAGSGSTGHSVIELNSEDSSSKRRVILNTIDENNIYEDVLIKRIEGCIKNMNSNQSFASLEITKKSFDFDEDYGDALFESVEAYLYIKFGAKKSDIKGTATIYSNGEYDIGYINQESKFYEQLKSLAEEFKNLESTSEKIILHHTDAIICSKSKKMMVELNAKSHELPDDIKKNTAKSI